nr:molybdopterin-dependent oxidoreductase [Gammaproteobacteria bacterium]
NTRDCFAQLESNPRTSLLVVDGIPKPGADIPEIGSGSSARRWEAHYERPYQAHGSIGPSAALALWDGSQLSVWTHSQGPFPLRGSLAQALGLDASQVIVNHALGAGCYGHNGADDAALDACLVAQAMPGRPVLLKWTREDEHSWEPFSSCMSVRMAADVDSAAALIGWSHETFSDTHVARPSAGEDFAGARRLLASAHREVALDPHPAKPNLSSHGGIHRNSDPIYQFPNKRIVKHLVRDLPLRVSAMRTLGAYANVFAIESFIDELAVALDEDRFELRLRYLLDTRAREVVERAARAYRRLQQQIDATSVGGVGFGFARYKNEKAYCAVVAQVEVTDSAAVLLKHAVIVADAGEIVDRAGVAAQLEGGFLQAASWTLYEAVTFDETGVTSRDWDSYPILRFDNVPIVETDLIDRPDAGFLGVGEASSGPTPAAIANAIYAACGLRVRRLPFTPDAIRQAAADT